MLQVLVSNCMHIAQPKITSMFVRWVEYARMKSFDF